MIRDCWFEKDVQDTTNDIFVIRQIKIDEFGNVTTKLFRFLPTEVALLRVALSSALTDTLTMK
jgi:hypothetical protein